MTGMLPSQVAGRHGSYATQFWRNSVAPHYRSRAAMRAAYSRKAINRRLVLPLDSHNWMRSLEVLSAGYARLGRTPEHYQAVLRDMVEHHDMYTELRDQSSTSASLKNSKRVGLENNFSAAAAPDILPAIDALRDKAYAGEIPSNGSLWVTLVWSYCTLHHPQEALDAFYQAKRRFHFSTLTLQHMAELLLPVLCLHGALREATALYDEYLKPGAVEPHKKNGILNSERQQRNRGSMDDAEARRWLAEAAARRGDWKRTQQFATAMTTASDVKRGSVDVRDTRDPASAAAGGSHRPTINSLFQSQERSDFSTKETAPPQMRCQSLSYPSPNSSPRFPSKLSSLPVLSTLSPVAVRRLFQSLCYEASAAATTDFSAASAREEQGAPRCLNDALACWEHLYGPLPTTEAMRDTHTNGNDDGASPSDRVNRRTPPIEDVHQLLNLYASNRRWETTLEIFCVVFLHRPSSVYLTATPADVPSLLDSVAAATVAEVSTGDSSHHDGPPVASLFPYEVELPLDAVALNLVFASLPKAAEPLRLRLHNPTMQQNDRRVLALPAAARPLTVVRLLDDLLTYRDDMVLTDVVMSVVGPALLQLGQVGRVFELLARTPMMLRARERKAAVQLTSYERELKAVLVALGYAAYALCPSEARRFDMVRCMPHLFPPEVVRRFAATAKEHVASPSLSSAPEDDISAASELAVLDGPVLTDILPNFTASSSTVAFQGGDTEVAADVSTLQPPSVPCSAMAAPSLLDRRWQLYTDLTHTQQPNKWTATSFRNHDSNVAHGSRLRQQTSAHHRGRSSSVLTALADDAMRRDFVRLHEMRHAAFTGSHAASDRDPRPMPVGLHDHASGWDFFGRGGEKVFSNHKRTAHPFTMHPKVMRDLCNPYRGWNPRQNSSLAHRENVIKWNGKSAV